MILPPLVFPALAYFAAASLVKIDFIKIVTGLTRIFDDFAFAKACGVALILPDIPRFLSLTPLNLV